MLSLTCQVEIKERNASDIITREIYNSSGKVTGYLTDEEYEREKGQFEGMIFVEVKAVIAGKHLRVRSAINKPEAKEFLVEQAMAYIGGSIAKNEALLTCH